MIQDGCDDTQRGGRGEAEGSCYSSRFVILSFLGRPFTQVPASNKKPSNPQGSVMPKVIAPLLALAALGLVACDDPPKEEQQRAEAAPEAVVAEAHRAVEEQQRVEVASEAVVAEARRAAEEQVRARLRIVGDMRLRAVQVYRQQVPDTFAVCGQINPAGATNGPFTPWVAVVTVRAGKAARTDLSLGDSNTEASRVYIESVDHCFEGGGQETADPQESRALPPLPSDAALAQQTTSAPVASTPPVPNPAAAPQPPPTPPLPRATAMRSVTTTAAHPVNIRSHPRGGGAVVRIVPRASVLRVFGEAPGGWFQVGEDQPFGWVHGSMLKR